MGQEARPNFKLTVIYKRKLVRDMHAHCVVNQNICVCINFLWPLCFICLCLYHLLRFKKNPPHIFSVSRTLLFFVGTLENTDL